MIIINCKRNVHVINVENYVLQYIRDAYHEDPEMYSNEIHTLEGLRAAATCAVRDVTGCSALKRYYCQLHFLQSRFPMGKDGAAAVPFTW